MQEESATLAGETSSQEETKPKKKAVRLEWIDIAKGIGVFIVFFCHATWQAVPPPWNHLPVSFVMPMYFLLAGLTYNNEKYRKDMKRFAITRGRQFMIPYAILMLLWIGMTAIIPNMAPQTTGELLFWFAYGAGPPTGSPHLWFLPMLYLGMIVFVFFDKLLSKFPPMAKWLLVIFFPLVTVFLNGYVSLVLLEYFPFTTGLIPWRLGGVFMTAAFLVIGNEIRRFISLRDWRINHLGLDMASIVGFAMILVAVSSINGFTDIASDNVGQLHPVYISVWLYLITGMIGTYITFACSSLIADLTTRFRDFMVRVGNSSQELYEIHPMILRLVPAFLGIFGIIVVDPVAEAVNMWVFNYIFIAIISIPLVFYVINKNKVLRFMFKGSTK